MAAVSGVFSGPGAGAPLQYAAGAMLRLTLSDEFAAAALTLETSADGVSFSALVDIGPRDSLRVYASDGSLEPDLDVTRCGPFGLPGTARVRCTSLKSGSVTWWLSA